MNILEDSKPLLHCVHVQHDFGVAYSQFSALDIICWQLFIRRCKHAGGTRTYIILRLTSKFAVMTIIGQFNNTSQTGNALFIPAIPARENVDSI